MKSFIKNLFTGVTSDENSVYLRVYDKFITISFCLIIIASLLFGVVDWLDEYWLWDFGFFDIVIWAGMGVTLGLLSLVVQRVILVTLINIENCAHFLNNNHESYKVLLEMEKILSSHKDNCDTELSEIRSIVSSIEDKIENN